MMLPEYASTSTRPPAGVLRGGLVGGMIVLGGLLSESATASSVPVPVVRDRTAASMPGQRIIGKGSRRTAEGADVSAPIAEIRRLSGLTWEELAGLFSVSRRTLHYWASGKPIAAANEQRVSRTLATLRRVDRGEARLNRAALLAASPEGDGIVLDLLRDERFDEAAARLGIGTGPALSPRPVSPTSMEARRPSPPAELLDARPERVHRSDGRLLAGKSVRLSSKRA